MSKCKPSSACQKPFWSQSAIYLIDQNRIRTWNFTFLILLSPHTFKLYEILIWFLGISIFNHFSNFIYTFLTIWLTLKAALEFIHQGQGSWGMYAYKTLVWHRLRFTPTAISSRIPAYLATQSYSWLKNTFRHGMAGACSETPSACKDNVRAKCIWIEH